MKSAFAIAFFVLLGPTAGSAAQQISCGDRPKIERSAEEKLKGDVQGKAQLLTRRLADADIQGTVETSKSELYQQHQDVGRDEIDEYFAWISCQTINSDSNLSTSDKLDKWMAVYKSILSHGVTGSALKQKSLPELSSAFSVFFIDGVKFSIKRLIPPTNGIVTMIMTITNINDGPTRLSLLPPWPTLTSDDGHAGQFASSEGIQECAGTAQVCAKTTGSLFEVQPNFPVNIVLRFRWPSDDKKPESASLASRILLVSTDQNSEPVVISLALPDIAFK